MKIKACFIAATGQNVGKTTACLGIISGLAKYFRSVGFMKPVGQEHIETTKGVKVDKDVLLFKDYFKLTTDTKEMSPILFPRGFTRDYLDGKIQKELLTQQIIHSFQKISETFPFTIVEGTGHTGVGSIAELSNVYVAKQLGLNMIIVAPGGLGSSFDDLCLNKSFCETQGVKIIGIILNRVIEEKKEMIEKYFKKAIAKWNIPLLGSIPYNRFLSTPTMKDFENLFGTSLLSGKEFLYSHYNKISLIATSVENYHKMLRSQQLIITPASREDIIFATLTKFWEMKLHTPEKNLEIGIILTGRTPPTPVIIEQVRKANIPMLYAPLSSYIAMEKIASFTAKMRKEDTEKIQAAVHLSEKSIDFDLLLSALKRAG